MPTPITILTANAILKDEDIIDIYKSLRLPEISISDPVTSQELIAHKEGLSNFLKVKLQDMINPYIDSRVIIKQNEARALLQAATDQSISVNVTNTTLEDFLSQQNPS